MALHTAPKPPSPRRRPYGWALAAVVGGLAVAVVVLGVPAPVATPPPALDAATVAALPVADSHAALAAAPLDPDPSGVTDGVVVHPPHPAAVYDRPGGTPIARVDPTGFGDTWFPVIAARGEWLRVLLPSRPNGATAWLRAAEVRRAVTPYLVRVDLGAARMDLVEGGGVVATWPVGTGKAAPTGRTFLLGAYPVPPVILPLAAHDTATGGPIAIHPWSTGAATTGGGSATAFDSAMAFDPATAFDPAVGAGPTMDAAAATGARAGAAAALGASAAHTTAFGTAAGAGCLRVPPDALARLAEVPLGTLVVLR